MKKEFIELINEHQAILYKVCNVYFYGNPYKEDYHQEILIRLWKAFPIFQGRSAFSTWMYKVALNAAIDIVRKQTIRPVYTELSKLEYNISDTDQHERTERRDELYQAINQLSEIEKAIIILYLEEYSYKEIAEIMGISETNAGVKINRVKNKLIKIFEK